MEFEALAIARARVESFRTALKNLVDTAKDNPEGLVVLDRSAYDAARALLAQGESLPQEKK